jgi:hypothetical protein
MQTQIFLLSKRQIAIRSNVDYRTVKKFLNNEKVLSVKEIKIKKAISEMINEYRKVNIEFNSI